MNTKQLIIYRDFQYQRLFDDMTLLLGRGENACESGRAGEPEQTILFPAPAS